MTARYYRTIRDARGAMSLDYGFDPFRVGQVVVDSHGKRHNRPTKAAMAALGYPVDAAEASREQSQRAETWARHNEREREVNAVHDRWLAAEARAAEERSTVSATCEEIFASVGLSPERCDLSQYGDDDGPNTVILTCRDRKIVVERDGATLCSAAVFPLCMSTTAIKKSGRLCGEREDRQQSSYADPTIGYVLEMRLGDRTFYRAVPMRGGAPADSEHADKKNAIIALTV